MYRKIIICYLTFLLPYITAEIVNIGIIYGSLGFGSPIFPDWQTALYYGSQLIPASASIPGYNIFDYPTRAMVMCSEMINEAGGIPLHDHNNTRLSVNTTFFNVNYLSAGSENALIADLTNPNGPYGTVKFIINVQGSSASWANACETTDTCIVISGQVPNLSDYICTHPLPADCINRRKRLGSRRFKNMFSSFYNFETMHGAIVDIWNNLGMKDIAIMCSPLLGDVSICNEIANDIFDNGMNLITRYSINITNPQAWSLIQASEFVSQLRDRNIEGIFFIAVSSSGLPTWMNTYIENFLKAMKILNWTPLAMEFQTLAISNLDPVLTQYVTVSYPFLESVRGRDFRAINTTENLELFPARNGHDSPAIFIKEYNSRFPTIPEPYAPSAAIYAQGMLIIFKLIELSGSTKISDLIIQSYIIRTPSHYGLLAFDSTGRLLGQAKDIIFGQYIINNGIQEFHVLTPISVAKSPIYPLPKWLERAFDPKIRYSNTEKGIIIVTCICIIYCCFYWVITAVYFKHPVIKASSPNFLSIFLLGSIMLLSSNFVNGLIQNDTTCRAQIWLITLGFSLMYGSVFVRVLRICYIFNSKKLTGRIIISDKLLLVPLGLMLIVDIIFNLVWMTNAGMNVNYISIDNHRPYYDYNSCISDSANGNYAYSNLAYKFLCILLGVICTFYAKNAPAEFNETTSIFSAIYSTTLICGLAVPIIIADIGGRNSTYVIQSVGIIILVVSLVSFIFIPKWYYIKTDTVSIFETRKMTYEENTSLHKLHSVPTKNKPAVGNSDNKVTPHTPVDNK